MSSDKNAATSRVMALDVTLFVKSNMSPMRWWLERVIQRRSCGVDMETAILVTHQRRRCHRQFCRPLAEVEDVAKIALTS